MLQMCKSSCPEHCDLANTAVQAMQATSRALQCPSPPLRRVSEFRFPHATAPADGLPKKPQSPLLVLPADQDAACLWARTLALLYPDVQLPPSSDQRPSHPARWAMPGACACASCCSQAEEAGSGEQQTPGPALSSSGNAGTHSSTHSRALAEWDAVAGVWELAHKYDMQASKHTCARASM
jgi:hypothetical protein